MSKENKSNGNAYNQNKHTHEKQRNTDNGNDTSRINNTNYDDESNCIKSNNEKGKSLRAEILIAMPHSRALKKYKTYLGLIDTGFSSSLMDQTLMQSTGFEMKSTKKTWWDTQAGPSTTNATVKLENYCLPQFSMKWKIASIINLFSKRSSDCYDFIIGHDILLAIELDILYSSK
jgi:hypothetical protein